MNEIAAGGQRVAASPQRGVARRLSVVDRFLPVWILIAMAVGLVLGRVWPGLADGIARWKVQDVSVPIAIGLFLMMYPILSRVRYERVTEAAHDWRMLGASLFLNWVVGPAFMFALAWLLLPDQPALRTGVILVGLARCIAMVLVWNQLAAGDPEYAAILVSLNAVFQILAYAGLAVLYLNVVPGWLGLQGQTIAVNPSTVAASVGIFLGVPLVLGLITQYALVRRRGREWYEQNYVARTGRLTLIGLLFTIVIMFALQGHTILGAPLTVARVVLPLLAYFTGMFALAFFGGWAARFTYKKATTLGFTAASNDFELAIAVAVTVFGVKSGQALASVVGPLVEVPVLLSLVYFTLWAQRRLFAPPAPSTVRAAQN